MGHQEVDDFTVVVPGCQHQAGHLGPERSSRQENREKIRTKEKDNFKKIILNHSGGGENIWKQQRM